MLYAFPYIVCTLFCGVPGQLQVLCLDYTLIVLFFLFPPVGWNHWLTRRPLRHVAERGSSLPYKARGCKDAL